MSHILADKEEEELLGYGKNGYYLASPGSVAWEGIYAAMGKAMVRRGVIKESSSAEEKIMQAGDEELGKMAEALGCGREMVRLMMGGL